MGLKYLRGVDMEGDAEAAVGEGGDHGRGGPALADPGDVEGQDLANGGQGSDGE